jgi:cytochrome c
MTAKAMLALVAAAWLAAGPSGAEAAPSPSQVQDGKRLAQRHCGGCHAVAAGASPLADAPPFRDIHRRYGPDGLRGLLSEGMIRPSPMPEEGSVRTHPRNADGRPGRGRDRRPGRLSPQPGAAAD